MSNVFVILIRHLMIQIYPKLTVGLKRLKLGVLEIKISLMIRSDEHQPNLLVRKKL